jgi:hypothetical protein
MPSHDLVHQIRVLQRNQRLTWLLLGVVVVALAVLHWPEAAEPGDQVARSLALVDERGAQKSFWRGSELVLEPRARNRLESSGGLSLGGAEGRAEGRALAVHLDVGFSPYLILDRSKDHWVSIKTEPSETHLIMLHDREDFTTTLGKDQGTSSLGDYGVYDAWQIGDY